MDTSRQWLGLRINNNNNNNKTDYAYVNIRRYIPLKSAIYTYTLSFGCRWSLCLLNINRNEKCIRNCINCKNQRKKMIFFFFSSVLIKNKFDGKYWKLNYSLRFICTIFSCHIVFGWHNVLLLLSMIEFYLQSDLTSDLWSKRNRWTIIHFNCDSAKYILLIKANKRKTNCQSFS